MEGTIKSIYLDKKLIEEIHQISMGEKRSFSNQVSVLLEKQLKQNKTTVVMNSE